MGQNSHTGDGDHTQNQSNAMSDDPKDGDRLTDNPEAKGGTAVNKAPKSDAQDQDAIEEFGQRGMGVAAKE